MQWVIVENKNLTEIESLMTKFTSTTTTRLNYSSQLLSHVVLVDVNSNCRRNSIQFNTTVELSRCCDLVKKLTHPDLSTLQ